MMNQINDCKKKKTISESKCLQNKTIVFTTNKKQFQSSKIINNKKAKEKKCNMHKIELSALMYTKLNKKSHCAVFPGINQYLKKTSLLLPTMHQTVILAALACTTMHQTICITVFHDFAS